MSSSRNNAHSIKAAVKQALLCTKKRELARSQKSCKRFKSCRCFKLYAFRRMKVLKLYLLRLARNMQEKLWSTGQSHPRRQIAKYHLKKKLAPSISFLSVKVTYFSIHFQIWFQTKFCPYVRLKYVFFFYNHNKTKPETSKNSFSEHFSEQKMNRNLEIRMTGSR